MELEDLKKGWKEMESRIDRLEGELKMERHKKRTSARDRLEWRYRILTIVCFVTPISFKPLMGMAQFSERTEILFCIFFIIMGIICAIKSRRIANLDMSQQSIKETLVKLQKEQKLFKYKPLWAIALATPVILSIIGDIYALNEPVAMYGVYGGLFFGALLGLFIRRRIMIEWEAVRKALEEEISE